MSDRLDAQINFLSQADRLKSVDRQNVLQDFSRPENSAEHSWHTALFALVLDHPLISSEFQRDEVISHILLHDIVEIDAGDHPIHLNHDIHEVAQKERDAANRLFGLLPRDQSKELRANWDTFEASSTINAQAAKQIDFLQPIIQASAPKQHLADQISVVLGNLTGGRARNLHVDWPDAFAHVNALIHNKPCENTRMAQQLDFLIEADRLKSVYRATRLHDGSRFENSAEHSWHIALYALILKEYCPTSCDIHRVIRMLLIHDIVEIDAGDDPIHGDFDPADMQRKEAAAADRIFGLLPADQGKNLLRLWHEFEEAQTVDAQFAKALDRMPAPLANMEIGGGSWHEYNVTVADLEARLGVPISRGAPVLWEWLRPKIVAWYANSV
jgi:putative hydrolases of HD superfamily